MPQQIDGLNYELRTAILVAHPDDESLGAGLLLQRLHCATVVVCANGASWWPPYWINYGLPRKYARLRVQEARRAIEISGKDHAIRFLGYPDGRLVTHLSEAYSSLDHLFRDWKPQQLVTHAFEGGHEDHDVCSFLAYQLSKALNVRVWEMPLYYREVSSGAIIRQTFTSTNQDDEVITPLSASELKIKLSMLLAHQSQRKIIDRFSPSVERFRPQPVHDYLCPSKDSRPRRFFGISSYQSSKAFQRWETPPVI